VIPVGISDCHNRISHTADTVKTILQMTMCKILYNEMLRILKSLDGLYKTEAVALYVQAFLLSAPDKKTELDIIHEKCTICMYK
jgi:hypothetical protein